MNTQTTCPNCGHSDELPPAPFDRCQNCGIIISRYGEVDTPSDSSADIRNNSGLQTVIHSYIGRHIGLNLSDPVKLSTVRLANSYFDSFVVVDGYGIRHYFPFSQIIKISEVKGGKIIAKGLSGGTPLVVYVNHLVVYRGAIGFSISTD